MEAAMAQGAGIDMTDRERALEELVDAYGDGILQLAYFYLRDRDLAEDIFQEAFTRVYTQMHKFRGESSPRTWIYRIAVNLCRDKLRSWSMRKVLLLGEEFLGTMAPAQADAEDEVLAEADKAALLEAVMQLPLEYREVERLRQRIRRAEERPAPVRSPWLTRSVAAVAAVGVIVMIGQVASRPEAKREAAPPPVATEAARQQAPAMPPPTQAVEQAAPGSQVQVTQVYARAADQAENKAYDSDSVSFTDASGNASVQGVEAQPGRKIVLNAEYTLEVKDARSALEQLQNLAVASGGYAVEANLIKGQDGSANGRLVLRIPAGTYSGAIQQVRQTGEVKQERQWSQDVTERYMDLTARVKILQEHEQKLKELAQKAATFDDWLKLTNQINETRAQIENMQGQLKLLSNQVEYSTITIALLQPAQGFTPVPEGAGMWGAMAKAFNRSMAMLAGLGRSFLVGMAASVPFLVPAALVGAGAVAAVRRRRQRREP